MNTFSGMSPYPSSSCHKHETCALLLLAVQLIPAPSFGVFLCETPAVRKQDCGILAFVLAGHRSKEAEAEENTPELFGVALLNLRPLLHKFDVEVQQVDARLRVLFNLVVLVLRGEENRVKSQSGVKPRTFVPGQV